ncbi:unnamed protein product [Hermetia illucens]|uniref:Cytochrome P450 n=1 Tax=Hermetia illucens TaxID=343691 RepID=A0A7R8UF04_HERIL|nr:unnamed protein product [Hermetia illucens]
MTFDLHELSLNPDIQEKGRQEIEEVLKKYDGKITYESIEEMVYIDKIINETLRKYPPAPVVSYYVNAPTTSMFQIPI